MRDRTRNHWGRLAVCALALTVMGLALSATAGATTVATIGANVNLSAATKGTCGGESPAERPCMFLDELVPGQNLTAPCDGTITRFRLNGVPKPNNHYRLRVISKSADEQSFTGTASSAEVAIAVDGVNEYPTNLPITAGQTIGIDFTSSSEDFGLRWIETPGVGSLYFNGFPADGIAAMGTGHSAIYYLYNADITCTPSNEFKVLGLKGTALTVELASAGTIAVADTAKGKKKVLKPASASGGPGPVKLGLKLTAAAKKTLREKGKVRAKTVLTFTPEGGTASTQARTLTIKKPKKKSKAAKRPVAASLQG